MILLHNLHFAYKDTNTFYNMYAKSENVTSLRNVFYKL